MNIGDLKHPVTLQQPLRDADGGGGYAVTWQALAQAYAHIAEDADGKTATATLRWRDDVAAGMRLVSDESLFRVIAARDPDGNREWLELRLLRE
jgi:head-tail adaptor